MRMQQAQACQAVASLPAPVFPHPLAACSLFPCVELNAAITGNLVGNSALTNLPRKINIGLSSTRDDFAHCHINDVGLKVGGRAGGRAGGWVGGWVGGRLVLRAGSPGGRPSG